MAADNWLKADINDCFSAFPSVSVLFHPVLLQKHPFPTSRKFTPVRTASTGQLTGACTPVLEFAPPANPT